MIACIFGGLWARPWAALRAAALGGVAALAGAAASTAASAAGCPGHPNAIGTSRTIAVDPRQHPKIGTMHYRATLPLQDREVVLTFDDGPLPKYSDQILDILAAHCAKATFFLVGSQATANPEGVRKVRDAGHTIATHTQNHPPGMDRLPLDRASLEIDEGIASVTAALADGTLPAPFFRSPGLRRNDGIEEFAAARGLQMWSADFLADDWRDVSALRVYELAIRRIEAKGKGILLLHDIQPRTVAALPGILRELKTRGFRIVHVVPASAARTAATEPKQGPLRPAEETMAEPRWPKVPAFNVTSAAVLPAPATSHFDWRGTESGSLAPRRPRGAALSRTKPWPRQVVLSAQRALPALPTPAESIFSIPQPSARFAPRPTEASAAIAKIKMRSVRVTGSKNP